MQTSTLNANTFHTLKRPIHRVALACIQCRSRKVKCDATLPRCNRCVADGKTCEYQKSRRGGRPRRPVTATLQVAAENGPAPLGLANTPRLCKTFSIARERASSICDSSGSMGRSTHSIADTLNTSLQLDNTTLGGTCLTPTQIDQLLSQYYCFFHTAHPCIVPRWSLRLYLDSEPIVGETLLPQIGRAHV